MASQPQAVEVLQNAVKMPKRRPGSTGTERRTCLVARCVDAEVNRGGWSGPSETDVIRKASKLSSQIEQNVLNHLTHLQ